MPIIRGENKPSTDVQCNMTLKEKAATSLAVTAFMCSLGFGSGAAVSSMIHSCTCSTLELLTGSVVGAACGAAGGICSIVLRNPSICADKESTHTPPVAVPMGSPLPPMGPWVSITPQPNG